ncbi:MAG TPA: putative O-glycosylation ligase, exosortase A system-associated [Falsiroseomonas sp.]|jgi:probable O-glycosylation ligase (exosortase A-associated)|nr:putative O-glycosylation ligase, exosortase A system-associated [Falsiroseomonas sp.]
MRSYIFIAFYSAMLPLAFVQPFVGALLWCWIAFMNPHREVWGFATNLPYATIVFVATVIACVLAREPKKLAANGVTIGLIVFAALITLTSLTSIGDPSETWRLWERTMKTILGALLVASLLTSRERIHALVWLMAISLGFYGVKGGIFTLMTGGGFMVLGPSDSMISDRNHVAVGLLVAVPLMNYIRMQSAHRLVQFGIMGAMGLTVMAAIGSQSRGALLALAATAAVLWWRSRGKVVSGVMIVACVAGVLSFMPASWEERMRTITTYEEDASAMGRVQIWRAAFLIGLDRPLIGAGFRAPYQPEIVARVAPDVTARAVHSIYFEVIGEHGFPAFGVWCFLTAAGVYYSMRLVALSRDRPDLAWAGDLGRMVPVSITAYLSGGAFLSLSYWDYYWTILIVVAAAHALVLRTLRERAPKRTDALASSWRQAASQGTTRGAPQGAAARGVTARGVPT